MLINENIELIDPLKNFNTADAFQRQLELFYYYSKKLSQIGKIETKQIVKLDNETIGIISQIF